MKIRLCGDEIDRAYHTLKENLDKKYTRWHDFREVGIEEDYHDYYYAEEGLIVIRDRLTEQLWMTYARSPGKALEQFRDMLKQFSEVMDGDEYAQ